MYAIDTAICKNIYCGMYDIICYFNVLFFNISRMASQFGTAKNPPWARTGELTIVYYNNRKRMIIFDSNRSEKFIMILPCSIQIPIHCYKILILVC